MFKLDFQIPIPTSQIHYTDRCLSLGSCFSDHIGQKLTDYKFDVLSNPFGTIYNPISIFQLVKNAIDNDMDYEDIIEVRSVNYHWEAHSKVSATEKQTLLSSLRNQLRRTHEQLAKANWIIITLGSAYVYRLNESGKLVANCHKVSKSEFTKELLSVKDIIDEFDSLMNRLNHSEIKANILLTVSPVRHIRDGLVENNLSKSALLQATHQLVNSFDQVHYFPAYEIMIDELRDYRFYKEDMVHPNEQAVNYIWDRLVATYFDPKAQKFVGEWGKLLKAINHQPFHPETADHQLFIKNTINKLKSLPYKVDVSEELNALQKQLI